MSGDYAGQVRAYLKDCQRAATELQARGSFLDPRYHPAAAGCCKAIPHGGDPGEAKKIRETFREATEGAAGGQDKQRREKGWTR